MENSFNIDFVVTHDLIIDEKFARMFPVLDERTGAGLEESILEFGCVIPLIVWDGVLLDYADKIKMPMLVNVGRIVSSYV